MGLIPFVLIWAAIIVLTVWNCKLHEKIVLLEFNRTYLEELFKIQDECIHDILKDHAKTIDKHAASIHALKELLYQESETEEDKVIPLEFHNYHSKHA